MSDDRNDDFWRTMYFAEGDGVGSGGSGIPYGKIFLIGGVCFFVLALLLGVEIPWAVVELYLKIAAFIGVIWLLKRL